MGLKGGEKEEREEGVSNLQLLSVVGSFVQGCPSSFVFRVDSILDNALTPQSRDDKGPFRCGARSEDNDEENDDEEDTTRKENKRKRGRDSRSERSMKKRAVSFDPCCFRVARDPVAKRCEVHAGVGKTSALKARKRRKEMKMKRVTHTHSHFFSFLTHSRHTATTQRRSGEEAHKAQDRTAANRGVPHPHAE